MEVAKPVQRLCVGTPCHLQVVVVDVFMGRYVWLIIIERIKRVDKIGLASFKHIGGHVPIQHNKLVGDVELVENQVEYIDIVSGGLALGIDKLERPEVPVAGNRQRMFVGVAEVVGSMEQGRTGEQAKEQSPVPYSKMQCISCHDAHNFSSLILQSYFLCISLHVQGMMIQTMVPLPSSDLRRILPPMRLTTSRQMDRPRPLLLLSVVTKRSKILSS